MVWQLGDGLSHPPTIFSRMKAGATHEVVRKAAPSC